MPLHPPNADVVCGVSTPLAFQAGNGYLAGSGEFEVRCEYDAWVPPPHGWPDAAHCVPAGAAGECDLTAILANSTTPAHLTRSESSDTNLPSGEYTTYTCSDSSKELRLGFMPFKR